MHLIDINFYQNFNMRVLEVGVSKERAGSVGLLWEEVKLFRVKVEYFCCFLLH